MPLSWFPFAPLSHRLGALSPMPPVIDDLGRAFLATDIPYLAASHARRHATSLCLKAGSHKDWHVRLAAVGALRAVAEQLCPTQAAIVAGGDTELHAGAAVALVLQQQRRGALQVLGDLKYGAWGRPGIPLTVAAAPLTPVPAVISLCLICDFIQSIIWSKHCLYCILSATACIVCAWPHWTDWALLQAFR